MIEAETIIVGAGPAGTSAAWALRRQGRECLLLDRDAFPREKLCAGWITPAVLTDLEFRPRDYPYRFLTFDELRVKIKGFPVRFPTRQYSIRRFEFDRWLLERTGVNVRRHKVKSISAGKDDYVIDERYRCRYLVGAGGTRCPVYRKFLRDVQPREKALQTVTLELEYACDWHDERCHLWFFDGGLPGYSWYVPKAEGYLNVGIGGMAAKLQAKGDHIRRHWDAFVHRLMGTGLIAEAPGEPTGYSYYLWSDTPPMPRENVYLIGDALGLASRDLCEGIGPAVRSGINAARAIANERSSYEPDVLDHTLGNRWVSEGLARMLA